MVFIVVCALVWAVGSHATLLVNPSFTLTISSVVLCVPMPCLVLPGSRLNVPGLNGSGCVSREVCPPQHLQGGQEECEALECVRRQ